MPQTDGDRDVVGLLPLAAGLWLGYLLTLLAIDYLIYARPLPSWYYLLNAGDALLVLGLAIVPGARRLLGRGFVPLVIALLAVVPIVLAQLATMQPFAGPQAGQESVLLRTMPLQLMGLILTVWRYDWRPAVLFIAAMMAAMVGLNLLFYAPGGAPLKPPLVMVAVQGISALAVGYFIRTLVRRLRQQQESLTRANAELASYSATVEELATSRERNRLARELHDTLAHALGALSVQLETVKAYLAVDLGTAGDMLDLSLEVTRSGLDETRRALKSLRASPLEDLGLALALREMVTAGAQRGNLRLQLDVPEHVPLLGPDVEQCIFRVAQEAVANVLQHAQAFALSVRLELDGGVLLQVTDDGRGFSVAQAERVGRFGLAGMRERARLMGGTLAIASRPGSGTTVTLSIGETR